MGFCAVIRTTPGDDFTVAECHINLWSLAGIFKRRRFFLDVGLRLRAGDKEVSAIELALPLGIYGKEAHGLEDLYDLMLDTNVSQLIFGGHVEVDREKSRLRYDSSTLGPREIELAALDLPSCKRNSGYSGKEFSYWLLQLNAPIRREPDTYLRVRFKVRNLGRTWIWKKSGLARNGALLDLRVTDLRESYVETEWRPSPDKLVPIDNLRLFVIAPSWLQLRAVSPPYHYMRLFEGRVWEKYLKRAVDLRRREKLVIYQWRNKQEVAVSPANPFHAFIDFSQEFGLFRLGNHIRTALLVVLFVSVVAFLKLSFPRYAKFVETLTQTVLSSRVFTATFLIALIGGMIWVLFRYVERFQKLLKHLRNRFLAFEERRFRRKMQS